MKKDFGLESYAYNQLLQVVVMSKFVCITRNFILVSKQMAPK